MGQVLGFDSVSSSADFERYYSRSDFQAMPAQLATSSDLILEAFSGITSTVIVPAGTSGQDANKLSKAIGRWRFKRGWIYNWVTILRPIIDAAGQVAGYDMLWGEEQVFARFRREINRYAPVSD